MYELLDGKLASQALKQHVKEEIAALAPSLGRVPCLAVILVGDNAGSQVYVRNKERAAAEVGMDSRAFRLPDTTTQQELLDLIDSLNADAGVDGILLQLPLPKGLDQSPCLERISPTKDVDGLHPENQGRLALGHPGLRPCTPSGVISMLEHYKLLPRLVGARAVVVGRSNLVGKPLATMLTQLNATVTICHSKSSTLKEDCQNADFLFLAIGQAKFLKADYVKEGAIVVDIGMNREETGLCGDVDFGQVAKKCSYISPVPGGVGLMTIAQLMSNTLQAWKSHLG